MIFDPKPLQNAFGKYKIFTNIDSFIQSYISHLKSIKFYYIYFLRKIRENFRLYLKKLVSVKKIFRGDQKLKSLKNIQIFSKFESEAIFRLISKKYTIYCKFSKF